MLADMTAAMGARIIASDVDGDAATATADAINTAGGEAVAVRSDVTVRADLDDVLRIAVDRWGSVDVLVNKAHRASRRRGETASAGLLRAR